MNIILVAFICIGLLKLLRVVVALSILGTQLAIVTWFNPIPGLYHQTYPLLALGLVATLLPFTGISTTQKTLARDDQPYQTNVYEFIMSPETCSTIKT